jgi:hypothetical protein
MSYVDVSITISRSGVTPTTRFYYYVTGDNVTSNKVSVNSNDVWKAGGKDEEDLIPTVTSLNPNYPNPFNPSTALNYDLATNCQVSIVLYDMIGREIKTLVDEFQDAGYKSVTFDASDLPSGVYFYRLQAGGFTDIKKMVLLR